MKNNKLIVALDVESLEKVRELVEKLSPVVDIYKVGSQLFTACGPGAVRFIMAKGKKVFLDLKYHDIPNTVAKAIEAATGLSIALERTMGKQSQPSSEGLFMLTVHTSGGEEMLKAAVEASTKAALKLKVKKPLLVGVTVLTSQGGSDNIQPLVLERALLAKKSGLDGVVASPQEARMIREKLGKDFIIVTPGIRPLGSDAADQKRIATPAEAIKAGSNFLVVGRPIVEAKDPLSAAKEILEEID